MDVAEAVASRRSIRAFTEQAVEPETLRRVLEAARMAPSGCNYQPWEATVLTGAPLKALQEVLLAASRTTRLNTTSRLPRRRKSTGSA